MVTSMRVALAAVLLALILTAPAPAADPNPTSLGQAKGWVTGYCARFEGKRDSEITTPVQERALFAEGYINTRIENGNRRALSVGRQLTRKFKRCPLHRLRHLVNQRS